MTDAEMTDPVGRSIRLRDRTWFGHIVKGHPDVASHRRLVESTVSQPQEIRTSSSDTDCRKYIGPGPRPSVKMVVVVDVVIGIVKTAYLARRISGDLEWPSEPM